LLACGNPDDVQLLSSALAEEGSADADPEYSTSLPQTAAGEATATDDDDDGGAANEADASLLISTEGNEDDAPAVAETNADDDSDVNGVTAVDDADCCASDPDSILPALPDNEPPELPLPTTSAALPMLLPDEQTPQVCGQSACTSLELVHTAARGAQYDLLSMHGTSALAEEGSADADADPEYSTSLPQAAAGEATATDDDDDGGAANEADASLLISA